MVSLTIDGYKLNVDEGWTLLEAASSINIDIPTLCYHPALSPYGSCRLCTVEVEQNGRKFTATACNFPVQQGIVVNTDTEAIREGRKKIIQGYLARCPDSIYVQRLAERYEVEKPPYTLEVTNCLLCGLCVRACKELAGVGAISISNRGFDKEIRPPFNSPSPDCIGCGTCLSICPANAMEMRRVYDQPSLHQWVEDEAGRKCRICGTYELQDEFPESYEAWFSEE